MIIDWRFIVSKHIIRRKWEKPDWWLIMLGILAMLAVFIGFVLSSKYVRPRIIGILRQMERRKRRQLEGLGWMVGDEPDKDWLERV